MGDAADVEAQSKRHSMGDNNDEYRAHLLVLVGI